MRIFFNDNLFDKIAGKDVVKYYCPVTSGDQFLEGFSIDSSAKYPDMGITLGLIGGMLVLAYIVLRYVRHLKR